jgi:hypothetical protein
MNEKTRDYLLIGVTALTLINSYFVFTGSRSGRVIETPSTSSALVESTMNKPAIDPVAPGLDVQKASKNADQPAKPAGPPTTIAFAEMEFDFGTIKQNSENVHVFKFINTGPNPLIIQDAKGSCGCTVPKYPKQPVGPGETGEIEVVYKPGTQEGNQTKTVTLTANTEPNQTVLKINAMVVPEKKDS